MERDKKISGCCSHYKNLKSDYAQVDELIKKENQKVRAYESNDKWYGVTYKEDTPDVKRALQNLMKEGYYDGI